MSLSVGTRLPDQRGIRHVGSPRKHDGPKRVDLTNVEAHEVSPGAPMYVHRLPVKVQTSSNGDGTSRGPTPPRSRHSRAPCVRSCRALRELWQTNQMRVFHFCWSPIRSRCSPYRHHEPTREGRLRRGPSLRFVRQVRPWRTSSVRRFRCDQPPTSHPWSPRSLSPCTSNVQQRPLRWKAPHRDGRRPSRRFAQTDQVLPEVLQVVGEEVGGFVCSNGGSEETSVTAGGVKTGEELLVCDDEGPRAFVRSTHWSSPAEENRHMADSMKSLCSIS